jgi:tryptophan halogenase
MKVPQRFVIIGGGTAGWMAAAALSKVLRLESGVEFGVTLIESEDIGSVGVGEATIPPILDFLKFLNIDESEFMRATNATYKLGIEFVDWLRVGQAYWHPFGSLGPSIENRPLFQHWLRARLEDDDCTGLMALSIGVQLAKQGRFAKPSQNAASSLGGLGYALHFDAVLAAQFLRHYAQKKGVSRTEGKVVDVIMGSSGDIVSVIFADGRCVEGDFFIDCSGFRALLIEKALGAPFEDWSHWLPCDRAVAVQSRPLTNSIPYTISTAREAGWTWQIPLKGRVGNGYVYASAFTTPEAAQNLLLRSLNADPLNEPRHLSFKAGRRRHTWVKNGLSLGLAAGFLEPLESTSIHLVFANIFRFLEFFPGHGDYAALRDEFNRRGAREIEEIRDFLILHYCLSARGDSELWHYVTNMDIPDSLKCKIETYRALGRITSDYYDLFKPVSWISVLDGMGIVPATYDPLVGSIPKAFSNQVLNRVRGQIEKEAASAKKHIEMLP